MKNWNCHGTFVAISALLAALTAGEALGQQSADGPHPVQTLNVERTNGVQQLALDDGQIIRQSQNAITDAKLISVPDSTVELALWNERASATATPYYSISLNGRTFAAPQPTSYVLKMLHGDFEPLTESPAIETDLRSTAAQHLYIVQFVVQPLDVFREQLRGLGASVYSYFPHHAHIVKMDEAVRAEVEALPYVRAIVPYHPAFRFTTETMQGLRNTPGEAKRYGIQVADAGEQVKLNVANALNGMGALINKEPGGSFLFEATLTPAQLDKVSRLDEVLYISEWTPPQSTMNHVRIVGGANYVESVAGYTGTGVRAEVMDNGCQIDHPDFAGRIEIRGNTSFPDEVHGTSTFGIVFGSGAGSSTARGMLPNAYGFFNDWNYTTSRYDDIGQLNSAQYSCLFQSNSWGFQDTRNYTTFSAEMDRAVFDHDIVILHSMGNTGNTSGVEHAWAKNVVGVGGVYHYDNSNLGDDNWTTGAGSIGPASDGRIKPDLCYYYHKIRTTYPGSTYWNDMGGTSAACPETAGHFGLFFQMWADGIFGNPVDLQASVFENRPHNSTARAMMINSAYSYPFSGTSDPLTRVHQGWGLANVQNLYDRRDNFFVVNEEDVLEPLESTQYGRTIDAGQPGSEQLRITLVWTDKAAVPGAGEHQVNDLDLKVTSPIGDVYWGNAGLTTGNWSTLGGSPDTLNTIENVFLDAPLGGNWTIEVIASEINQDGHIETPQVDADYALVISGGVDCPGPVFAASPPATVYTCFGNDVQLAAQVGNYTSLQWYHDGTPLTGETNLTLDLTDFALADEGEYWLEASNDCVTYASSSTMVLDRQAPTIAQQPNQPPARCAGSDTTITMTAGGVGPFTYQWFHNGEPAPGKTSASMSLLPATTDDAGQWFCRVSNPCYSTDSNTVTLTINVAPEFLIQPESTCASLGDTVVLTTDVTPKSGVFVQWRKASTGTAIAGGETLTLTNVQESDADGYYAYAFTLSPTCTAESEHATLTVATSQTCSQTAGDLDGDGDYDLFDMHQFMLCFGADVSSDFCCACANVYDADTIIDVNDWSAMELLTTGPQ